MIIRTVTICRNRYAPYAASNMPYMQSAYAFMLLHAVIYAAYAVKK